MKKKASLYENAFGGGVGVGWMKAKFVFPCCVFLYVCVTIKEKKKIYVGKWFITAHQSTTSTISFFFTLVAVNSVPLIRSKKNRMYMAFHLRLLVLFFSQLQKKGVKSMFF